MEPREAAALPVPNAARLAVAWAALEPECRDLDRRLRAGAWSSVVERVDDMLLGEVMGPRSASDWCCAEGGCYVTGSSTGSVVGSFEPGALGH